MKIGILTLPLHTNYGGILQAYALQTVLQRMGHEVKVIQKTRRNLDAKNPSHLVYLKAIVSKYIFRRNISIRVKKSKRQYIEKWIKEDKIVRQNTWPFIQRYIHLREIDGFCQLNENEFDALIVGSDQIWRKQYIGNTLCSEVTNAFLGFAKTWRVKRLSYAASFGVDRWEFGKWETYKIRELIKRFDAVSVREESGVSLCMQNLKYPSAIQMPDPTFLLELSDYWRLIEDKPKNNGTLHSYILDDTEEKKQFVVSIAHERGLIINMTNSKTDDWSYPLEDRIQPPLENWLCAFRDSDFVISDSFHACVFSIIFRKQFLVIGNPKRGMARFETLLKYFGLENHLISDINSYDFKKYAEIDYNNIEENLNTLRTKGLNYLLSNL